ncbi:MAG: FliA/WhiG family RNA polymerase sigma factor [Bdellovibrionota bacterium]
MKPIDQYQNQKMLAERLTPEEKSELIHKFVPLVKIMAYRMIARLPATHMVDDLISCGNIGLLEAVESFNPKLQIKFETFAKFRIRGAMIDEMRQRDWIPRSVRSRLKEIEAIQKKLAADLSRMPEDQEVAAALGMSLEEYHHHLMNIQPAGMISYDQMIGSGEDAKSILDFIEDKSSLHPDLEFQIKELREKIISSLEQLSPDEQLVMSLYYYEGLTLKEIAEVMKVTESRVSQIHAKSLHRLNCRLNQHKGEMEDLEVLQKITE